MSDLWEDMEGLRRSGAIRDCVQVASGAVPEEACGVCAVCRRRAAMAVADWVVREQVRRKNTAVSPRSLEQRRYVKSLTADLLGALGLVEEQPRNDRVVRNWARVMRAQQKPSTPASSTNRSL